MRTLRRPRRFSLRSCRISIAPDSRLSPALALHLRDAWRSSAFCQLAAARQLDRAPQIPGRDTAIRLPALAELREGPRRRHRLEAVRQAKAGAYAEIIDRQHVAALELEHQHHFDRPAADAAHAGEALDDREIGEERELSGRWHHPFDGLAREILERCDFGRREAYGAQLLVGNLQRLLGRRKVRGFEQRDEAPQNAFRRDAVQLLMCDGAGEGLKRLLLLARFNP